MSDGAPLVRPATLRLVEPALAARVVAPNYDTLDPTGRRTLARREPLSWVHALQTADDHAGDLAAALDADRREVQRLLDAGVFGAAGPRFAWYRLTDGDHRQTGLVAEVAVDAYDRGAVLPHEATRAERLAELTAYLATVGVASSPVALGHAPHHELSAMARAATTRDPAVDLVVEDGIRHTLWPVDAAVEVAAVRATAAALDQLWILDGHHRMAAASAYAASDDGQPDAPSQWVLAVLFGLDELRALPFHRVAALDMPAAEIRDRLSTVGRLTPLAAPPDVGPASHSPPPVTGTWPVRLDGGWHLLELTEAAGEPFGATDTTDVELLQERVLSPALGITDPRQDPRLRNVAGGPPEVVAACDETGAVGFLVQPVSVDRLAALAAEGHVLPPKSTRIHPKVRSGLLLRHLDGR